MRQPEHLIAVGDCRKLLPLIPSGSVHCVVTSPPYWGLRDYGTGRWEGGDPECEHTPSSAPRSSRPSGGLTGGKATVEAATIVKGDCPRCGARRVDRQIGIEESPEAYVETMVAVFREVRRILRDDGVCWLNLGDCYASDIKGSGGPASSSGLRRDGRREESRIRSAESTLSHQKFEGKRLNHGLKPKDLCMIPERVALALQADGWWIRANPPWIKSNPMPESVVDRPTTAHESVFLLTKSASYFYDADAVRAPNRREPHGRQGRHSELQTAGPMDRGGSSQYDAKEQERIWAAHGGRNRRTADWFFESLEEAVDWHEVEAARHRALARHFRDVRERGGILLGEDGTPLAFKVSTTPFPGAHFAVMSGRLVDPMIRLGTSEAGCCPKCGAPWERETEREAIALRPNSQSRRGFCPSESRAIGNPQRGSVASKSITTGWEPGCRCSEPPFAPVPCTVFDPFTGAGTAGSVADGLGRRFVGIELNPDYAAMAAKRISRPHAPVERPPAPSRGQQTFFD